MERSNQDANAHCHEWVGPISHLAVGQATPLPVCAVLVNMMWGQVERDVGGGGMEDQKKIVRWGGNIINITPVI